MNYPRDLDASRKDPFATTMEAQREAIARVARDVGADGSATLRIGDVAGEERAAIIEVPLRNFTYRTSLKANSWKPGREVDLSRLLRSRLEEVLKSEDRFSARLRDVRNKILPSLERNGGMRLVALQMNPASIERKFEWFENLIVADVESLDAALRPCIREYHGFTARARSLASSALLERSTAVALLGWRTSRRTVPSSISTKKSKTCCVAAA